MIPLDSLVAFAVASVVIIAIPGPSVLFVIGRSLSLGRRAGVLSVVGNALGTVPAVLAVAFGVGAIVASSVVAFTLIKIVGAAYLVWLGVQAIRHRHDHVPDADRAPASAATLLRQGFIVGLTNPKTIAFFVAVLRSSSSGGRPGLGPASSARSHLPDARTGLRQRVGPRRRNRARLVRPLAASHVDALRHRRRDDDRARRHAGPDRRQELNPLPVRIAGATATLVVMSEPQQPPAHLPADPQ